MCNPDAHFSRYPGSTCFSYFTHDPYGYTTSSIDQPYNSARSGPRVDPGSTLHRHYRGI